MILFSVIVEDPKNVEKIYQNISRFTPKFLICFCVNLDSTIKNLPNTEYLPINLIKGVSRINVYWKIYNKMKNYNWNYMFLWSDKTYLTKDISPLLSSECGFSSCWLDNSINEEFLNEMKKRENVSTNICCLVEGVFMDKCMSEKFFKMIDRYMFMNKDYPKNVENVLIPSILMKHDYYMGNFVYFMSYKQINILSWNECGDETHILLNPTNTITQELI